MTEKRLGYKVVRNWRRWPGDGVPRGMKRFISATALGKETHYHVGQATYQSYDMGPFAVFDELVDAIEFSSAGNGDVILMVEYVRSNEYMLWYALSPEMDRACLPNKDFVQKRCIDLPTGTVFARQVTPLAVLGAYHNIRHWLRAHEYQSTVRFIKRKSLALCDA